MHSNKYNWGKYQLVFIFIFSLLFKGLCDNLKLFFSKYIYNLDKDQFNKQFYYSINQKLDNRKFLQNKKLDIQYKHFSIICIIIKNILYHNISFKKKNGQIV